MEFKDLKYLFDNLANGDLVTNYYKKWYFLFARLIKVVTNKKISHCMGVFNVVRSPAGDSISFNIGEQVIVGGKRVIDYQILLSNGTFFFASSKDKSPKLRFIKKGVNLYYSKNKFVLTAEQNRKVAEFWNEEEDYELDEIMYTQDWFYKIFGRRGKKYDNLCSSAWSSSVKSVPQISKEIALKFRGRPVTPAELVDCSFLEPIVRIS